MTPTTLTNQAGPRGNRFSPSRSFIYIAERWSWERSRSLRANVRNVFTRPAPPNEVFNAAGARLIERAGARAGGGSSSSSSLRCSSLASLARSLRLRAESRTLWAPEPYK